MAKRTSNDGKVLEKIVAVINEAYKDFSSTEILRDVKLIDKEGGKGQIDVLIKVSVNGYSMAIAVECKDYNRPVEKDKILAFNSKCDMIEGISKKIFVASKGYQRGAINAARRFEVELYNVNEITEESEKYWSSVNSGRSASFINREIKQCVVRLQNGNCSDLTPAPNTFIFTKNGPFISVAGLVYKMMSRSDDAGKRLNQQMNEKLSDMDWHLDEGGFLNVIVPVILRPDEPMYLMNKAGLVHIEELEVSMNNIFKISSSISTQLKRYYPIKGNSDITDVITMNINGIETYRVINRHTWEEKVLFLNGDGKIDRMRKE